jgi:hypothetical protein
MVPFAALISAACEHNPTGNFPVARIVVTEATETLVIGTSVQFTATGYDANNSVVGINPTWSTAGGGGTAITQAGVFTAGTTPVTNTVTAAAGGVSGTATAIVIAGAAASITVTPTPVTLAIATNQQFTAVVKDASGNTLTVTPNWSVAAGGGTINTTGLFSAGTVAGTYTNTVTASVGSLNGTATVTVSAAALASITVTPSPKVLAINGTQQFSAVGKDANGNAVSITPTWSVVASGGTISGTGLFTAGNVAGPFVSTVRACSTALCAAGSVSGFATVTVTPGLLATITVTPPNQSVGTGASQQYTAVGQDANGNIIPIVPVQTWSVQLGNAAGTISSSSGFYTAPTLVGVGFDTVLATSGLIVGKARVNVTASGALVSIAVTPNPASLGAGGLQQFTATGFDATGLIVPIPAGLVWSVVPSQAAAGTIDGNGLLTAGTAVGTYTNAVKALSGSISGFATVLITPAASLVNFGAAAPNGIMAGQAVTCITGGLISADVSISPGNTVTGFGPCVITGVQHLADAVALTAQNDLTTAYNTLFALPCPPANAIVANLGGTTMPAGVYCTASGIGVTGTLTLDGGGDPNANFVFQAGTSIVTAGNVVLINKAQAKNVYWLSGSSVTLGTASQFKGNVVALTSITLVDNATLLGRALARNGSVTLGTGNTITLP